jgi:hypothetical protein
VDAHLLQGYYKAADVLLLCYKSEFQKDQATNSHKLMEYLGSGKVIVATFTSEFAEFGALIEMTHSNSEFADVLDRVVKDIGYFNNKEISSKRKMVTEDNTYPKQLEKIEVILTKYIKK